jgi:hypothetical protein
MMRKMRVACTPETTGHDNTVHTQIRRQRRSLRSFFKIKKL